ncbi:MAG: hypothetical protein MK200_06470 [Nitrosopumilus sp.]|nr:hypothetical protein [Nitrosopumilus sp.]
MEIIDYGGWLTEDLKDYYKETIKERDRSEEFSDRRDLNKQAMLIMTEILKRRK